jgi:hypothetical protein
MEETTSFWADFRNAENYEQMKECMNLEKLFNKPRPIPRPNVTVIMTSADYRKWKEKKCESRKDLKIDSDTEASSD